MIITGEILDSKIAGKVNKFKDITCLISIINTEGNLGVVCYLQDDVWQPFCYTCQNQKLKNNAKTYRELINKIPPLDRNNILDCKGKFYNTFDTPVEVNNEILTTTFALYKQGNKFTLERKTYYLITDVQELERTFNANIMPCEIINFNAMDELYKERKVDDSLKYIVENVLNTRYI